MTLEYIDDYINKKLAENEEFIVFTYYELRIKSNLAKNEVDNFLKLAQTKLENIDFRVYATGEQYVYAGNVEIVKENELMVAIKNIREDIENGRKTKKTKH